LIGDPTKAQTKLGWKPKYDLGKLVKEMMAADVELFAREKFLKSAGYYVKNQFE
jgi:GDPmannose 4,6-dehydratase